MNSDHQHHEAGRARRVGALVRPAEGRVLAGVCAGLAERFGAEAVMLRGVLGLLCLLTAILPGVVVYLVLMVLMPDGRAPAAAAPVGGRDVGGSWVRSRRDRRIAGVCGGLAKWLGWDAAAVRVTAALLAFLSVGALAVGYLVAWVIVPEEPTRV